jgi:hypothetical protein
MPFVLGPVRLLEVCSVAVPARVYSEHLGDLIERVNGDLASGKRTAAYVRVLCGIVYVAIDVVHSVLRGNLSRRRD